MTWNIRGPRALCVALLVAVAGCASAKTAGPETDLWDVYWGAVRDASDIEPDEISHELTAIVPDAPGQIWRTSPWSGRPQVKVVTWSSPQFCTPPSGEPSNLPQGVFVWVSVCPQMQEFCRSTGLTGDALDARLRQRMGLPPGDDKTCFVEYWVDPADLFRPAADTRIDTTTVGPTAPKGAEHPHAEFLWNQTIGSYTLPSPVGYPWTRLGYTFDWSYRGGGPDGEWGPSEFVLRGGPKVTVEIAAVVPTQEYGSVPVTR